MSSFVFALLGVALLGVLVDIVSNGNSMIDYIYNLVVLIVIISGVIQLLSSISLL